MRPREAAVIALPNGFTLANLFFGIFGIVAASRGDFDAAARFIVFGGIADAVSVDFLPGDDEKTRRRVVDGLKRIPHGFEGFKTSWAA
jgi:hypothetical protein